MSTIETVTEKINDNNRKYVVAGIIILIFVVYYFLVLNPQLSVLRKVNPEIMVLKQDLEKVHVEMARMDQYNQQIQGLENKLSKMSMRVQAKRDVPVILQSISQIANTNNIRIDQIMPLVEKQEILLENTDGVYSALPILVEAKGTYHDFGRFVNAIEGHEISLNIQQFTIQNSSFDSLKHTIRVTLAAVVVERKSN